MSLNDQYWNQSIVKKDSLGREYCYIPNGVFMYGKDNITGNILSPFYMAKYPVSVAQFKHFVKDTGYEYNIIDVMDQLSPSADCPATPVSWENAKAYARWLRSITGEYYSLPSEEEWEVAARGSDGQLYPWGENIATDDQNRPLPLNSSHLHADVSGINTSNVSPFGCIDMVGNVWEWCLDAIDEDGEAHILRGGSCVNDISCCTCVSRCYESPAEKRVLFAGFRLIYLPDDMYTRYRSVIEDDAL